MSKNEYKVLLKAAVILKHRVLVDESEINRSWGICSNLDAVVNEITSDVICYSLDRVFAKWPEGTGLYTCPVPSPHPAYSASEYYDWAYSNYMQWDLDTEYGQSRMRLLQYVIDSMVLQLGIW